MSASLQGIPKRDQDKLNGTASSNITVKSPEPTPVINEPPAAASTSNILNTYRSVTYNFTLAALSSYGINDPATYRQSSLDFVILKSGGKGVNGTNSTKLQVEKQPASRQGLYSWQNSSFDEQMNAINERASIKENAITKEIIEGFNKNSPGKFDMFIDNVEIETVMSFTPDSGVTLPTSIKFEVNEPYSINGFIEALHVNAIAAGYLSYTQASFLLKMEFVGYPDDVEIPEPRFIDKSTRYFVFGFTGLEVSITERGTRYLCSAVPFNERAFGQPNVLKKSIQIFGNTVGDILNDFFTKINQQIVESDKDSTVQNTAASNKYAIEFQTWDAKTGFSMSQETPIYKSAIVNKDTGNQKPAMQDPQNTNMSNASRVEGKPASSQTSATQAADESKGVRNTINALPSINFDANVNIHECITSVIRDSEYVTNILKTLGQTNNPDEFGMVDYFMVRLKVTNQSIINDISKEPFKNYTYVVAPYRMHYTRIPNYGSMIKDTSNLLAVALRTYNYLYTGKNIDVIDFKLNFNTLFFEAIPTDMGANSSPSTKDSAAPANNIEMKRNTQDTSPSILSENPQVRSLVDPSLTTGGVIKGNQPNNADPYFILATNMHNAVVDSKASMLTGNIKILGDPFYLATGGIGNYNPKPNARGETQDGEADQNFSEVLININFRNPVDIGDDGFLKFDEKLVPFSGIYRVLKVVSTFKDGLFTQDLDIIRVPGNIGVSLTKNDIQNQIVTSSKPEDTPATDVSTAVTVVGTTGGSGLRASAGSLLGLLSRGLPSIGLPGSLSNFTAAAGGLGGSVQSLLTQASGAVTNGIGNLTSAVSGLTSNLSSNLGGSAQSLLTQASGAVTVGIGNLSSAAGVFGSSIPGGVAQSAQGLKLSAQGLGLTSTDPATLAAGFGINTSQISGLSSNLQSKLSPALSNIINSIPPNTDIGASIDQGVILDNSNLTKLGNLPATSPFTIAPPSVPDLAYTKSSLITNPLTASVTNGSASAISNLNASQFALSTDPISRKRLGLPSITKL